MDDKNMRDKQNWTDLEGTAKSIAETAKTTTIKEHIKELREKLST